MRSSPSKIVAARRLLFSFSLISGLALSYLGWFGQASAAGNAQLYISPASKQVTTGDNFTANIRVNTGSESSTAIEVYGSYDQSHLQFVSIDGSSSAFDFEVEQNGGDGSFEAVRVAFSSDPSQDSQVVRLTFKALKNGSSEIKLLSSSKLSDAEGQLFNLELDKATISSSAPTTGGASGSSGGSGGGSGGGSSSSGSNSSGGSTNTTNNVQSQSGMSVTAQPIYAGYNLVDMRVSTSKRARVSISYGQNPEDLEFNTKQTKLSTTHQILLDSKVLEPDKTYYYTATAVDTKNTSVTTSVAKIETLGLGLQLQILDTAKQPVVGATVSLVEQSETSVKTDSQGIASFDSVPAGQVNFKVSTGFWRQSEHTVTIETSAIRTQKVQLNGSPSYTQTADAQTKTIELDYNPIILSWGNVLLFTGLAVGVAIALIIVIRLINVLRRKISNARSLESQQQTVVSPYISNPSPPSTLQSPPTVIQPPGPPSPTSQPGEVIAPDDPNKNP